MNLTTNLHLKYDKNGCKRLCDIEFKIMYALSGMLLFEICFIVYVFGVRRCHCTSVCVLVSPDNWANHFGKLRVAVRLTA